MCYCLFAIFSIVYFVLELCFLFGITTFTIAQLVKGELNLPNWLLALCLIWILIDQTMVLCVFGMFKRCDPTFKFISDNLGEVGICERCSGCC